MKYCEHCGAALTATDKFCPKCGTPVAAATAPAPAPQAAQPITPIAPVAAAQPAKPKRTKWLIGIGAAVVVILAAGGWWYTHQLYNLTHSRFRQATVYAWQGESGSQFGGVSPTGHKTNVAYMTFTPNGKVYWVAMTKVEAGVYHGVASTGTYQLKHNQLTFHLTAKSYAVRTDSVASLMTKTPKIAYKTKSNDGTYSYSLVKDQLFKYDYTSKAGKVYHETFKPTAAPVTVAKGGFDAQSIFTRWQAAKH